MAGRNIGITRNRSSKQKLETGNWKPDAKTATNMNMNVNPSYARYTNALYIYSLVLIWNLPNPNPTLKTQMHPSNQ
jgi:hypothetical protein